MKISSKDLQARHKITSKDILAIGKDDDEGETPEEIEYPPGFQEDPTQWQPSAWHADQTDVMNTRIGSYDWEPVEETREGIFKAYSKTIPVTLHEEAPGEHFKQKDNKYLDEDGLLEFFVAISPSSMRSNLELERAAAAKEKAQLAYKKQNMSESAKWFEKEQEHRTAAEQFATMDGWEYDLEVTWREDFIFHRERMFRSQPTDGSSFPLSGSGLAKAIAKTSEYIDKEIDSKTVGEFFEMVRQTKTRGPARLSNEEGDDDMKITSKELQARHKITSEDVLDIHADYGDDEMDVAPSGNHSAQLQMMAGAAMEALENLKRPKLTEQQKASVLNEVSEALIRISQYVSRNITAASSQEMAIIERMRNHNTQMQGQISTMAYHVGVVLRALGSTSVKVDTRQQPDRIVLDTAQASAQALKELVDQLQRMVG